MSINLLNPETVQGKIDASLNFLNQFRIAKMLGDQARMENCLGEMERHLFNAMEQIEQEQADSSPSDPVPPSPPSDDAKEAATASGEGKKGVS